MAKKGTAKPSVEKRDLFPECHASVDKNLSPRDFMETFCRRCRNFNCVNAGYADSSWEHRMATQVDRLLDNPRFADPESSRYEEIRGMDFQSLLREAIALNEVDRRGDWSVPTDGDIRSSAAKIAIGIGQRLSGPDDDGDGVHFAEIDDTPPEGMSDLNIESALAKLNPKKYASPSNFQGGDDSPDPPAPDPPAPDPRPSYPLSMNAPSQDGFVDVGATHPHRSDPAPKQAKDPWAVETEKVVKPGTRIKIVKGKAEVKGGK